MVSVWHDLTVAALAAKVQKGELSAVALVEHALQTIADKAEYQAIITTVETRARQRAQAIDTLVANGKHAGALAGVPFIAKDNFLALGAETTAASNILKGFTAPYQATAIERLEAAGAICVAKANLDAFGHGASTENSDFMTTKNPHDISRVPGGSSGGSAAAVVLGMVPFALGTDTGGSSRQPASFVGCVGFKPTYGLISRSGVVAMASSTDTIGTLARSVDDVATVVAVMAGQDPLDSTTIVVDEAVSGDLSSGQHGTVKGKKIGIIQEYMQDGLQPDVKQVVEAAIQQLRAAGADIQEISLPSLPLSLAVYYIVVPAEISSNLSRYDGQRFPFSQQPTTSLKDSYTSTRAIGFGAEAKRRIMIGTYVLSSGYYDAYYKKAQTVRTKLINEFAAAFKTVDFLIGPAAPSTAFTIGENVNDPLQMYLADVMTVGASLVGVPAIVIPGGIGTSSGLPVGVQLIAPQRADQALLGLAKQMQELLA